jgi:hypothetical protein
MPTDSVPAVPARPTAEIASLRRLVWFSAVFLAWGAFELGRWTAAAKPWLFSPVFTGSLGVLMMVASASGLRTFLRQLSAILSIDALGR